MRTVYLLRHGAHADVGHRLTGRSPDRGLTEAGRAQALAAAEALAGAPPSAIYSSPQRRTRETAAIVAERLGLKLMLSSMIDEVDFGDWAGRTFAELERDPHWHRWNADRGSVRCPGGETQTEAQARALAFASEVSAQHPGPVLLVSHCDIIRAMICWAEDRSLDQIHEVRCEPGSLHHLSLPSRAEAA